MLKQNEGFSPVGLHLRGDDCNEKVKYMKDDKIENKLLPHNYDLQRLADVLSGRDEIRCIFQPQASMQINGNGLVSPTSIQKIKELAGRNAEGLNVSVEYIPGIRYDSIRNIPSTKHIAVADELIAVNEAVTNKHFTFPQLMPINKKNRAVMQTVFSKFTAMVNEKHPKAKVGIALKPTEVRVFLESYQGKKPDYIIIDSGVKTLGKVIDVEKAIDQAGINQIETFCINAHVFIEDEEYAPSMQVKPISGFSINHGQVPRDVEPAYFNPAARAKSENGLTHYWTAEQMLSEYKDAQYPLKNLCPCEECSDQTIQSWFKQSSPSIIASNLRHKTLYVQERMKVWSANIPTYAKVADTAAKSVSTSIPIVALASSKAKGQGKVMHLSKAGLIASLEKKKVKAVDLAHLLMKAGYSFSAEELLRVTIALLISGKLVHSDEKGEYYVRPIGLE